MDPIPPQEPRSSAIAKTPIGTLLSTPMIEPPPWKPFKTGTGESLDESKPIAEEDLPSQAEFVSVVLTSPAANATASIIDTVRSAAGADKATMLRRLQDCVDRLALGSLEHAEGMALMQAKTLECVFHDLLRTAFANRGTIRFAPMLKLALRAQAQSARTLEVLGSLKKPAVFAEQMNLAQQQVINNSAPASPSPPPANETSRTHKTVRSAKKHKPQSDHGHE